MGRIEAEIDGIEHYYDENISCRGSRGSWVYIVPCERCGKKFKTISYGEIVITFVRPAATEKSRIARYLLMLLQRPCTQNMSSVSIRRSTTLRSK